MFRLRLLTLLLAAQSISSRIEQKMIGGRNDTISSFPHSAFLVINGRVMCGASIVRDRLLLTAAHCLYKQATTSVVEARVGSDDARDAPQKVRAKRWLIHENYVSKQFHNDLCLVYLSKSIAFGENVKKVLLDFDNEPVPGMECYVAGWGATAQMEMTGRHLKSEKQIIRTAAECAEVYPTMSARQLCAGHRANDNLPFVGDSGCALVYDGYRQVGLVSGGKPNISGYVIYNSIYHYKPWLIYATNAMLETDENC